MSLIRLKDNLKRPVAMAATGLFLFSAALFFSPVNLAHKITIPVGILAVSALWLCPWQIALALAFSAAGDYFGSVGNLMAQMGCFAIAHIWYIIYFGKRLLIRRKQAEGSRVYGYVVLSTALAILLAAFILITPSAPAGIIRIATSIYAILICVMLVLALIQHDLILSAGAALFVTSDFILAWSMFVEPVPHGTYWIMIPYYAAQYLIFRNLSTINHYI